MINYKDIQSKVITTLRFPLIVMVVYIHGIDKNIFSKFDFIPSNEFTFLTNIITNGVCRIAVPLFFLISGYLFFSEKWNTSIYQKKIKRRTHSLLIPYLLFNLIGIIVIGIFQWLMPELISGNYKTIQEYTIIDFLLAFWKMDKMNIPFIAPLWFVRNLMVAMLFSPIIYKGIQNLRVWFILPFFIAWYIDFYTFSIPGTMCLTFFSLGGYLRINNQNLVETTIPYRRYSLILYPILLIIGASIPTDSLLKTLIDNTTILCGIIASIGLVSWGVEFHDWKIPVLLNSATFFVYATHVPYMGQFTKIITRFIPESISYTTFNIIACLLYLITPTIFIILLIILYHLLKKKFPYFISILVGNRI